jgi:hypothetical protein
MGRFYSGDINGKFGFASQGSDDGEYFGAYSQESSYIPYYLDNEDIPEALVKLEKLIKEFNENAKPEKKVESTMTQDEFWDLVDIEWYQDNKNGLLASRIAMGLEIAMFNREYPKGDISFEAEL